jgi:predicted kinase
MLAAVRLNSDTERKRSLDDDAALNTGEPDQYNAVSTQANYAHLLRCAENCLRGGVNVIVDATFLKAEERSRFRALAAHLDASFVIVSCVADKAVMTGRIQQRAASRADPSEATVEVLERQLQGFVPLPSDELGDVIRVDTMQSHPERAAFATLQARQVNLAQREFSWPSRRERIFALRPSLQA